MPLVSIPSPSLIQGVSQQPPLMRFPSQGSAQENCYPSVLDGLQKRHPMLHTSRPLAGGIGDPLVHFINRDPSERYVVLAYGGSDNGGSAYSNVLVWDLTTGESVPVYSTLGWGNAADFSYLELPETTAAFSTVDPDFRTLTDWTGVNNIAAAQVACVPPLGTRFSGTNATTKVYAIGHSTAGVAASYTKTSAATGMLGAQGLTLSVYLRRDDVSGTPLTAVTLNLRDTTASVDHSATFTFSVTGAFTCTAGSIVNNAVDNVEALPNGWFRCSVTYVPNGSEVGHDVKTQLTTSTDGGAGGSILIWGLRVDEGETAKDWVPSSATRLKALTVADYTFLLNTTTIPLADGTQTTEDPNEDAGFIFVAAGNYKTNYIVDLTRSGGTPTQVQVSTWDGNDDTATVADKWTITFTGAWNVSTTGHIRFVGASPEDIDVSWTTGVGGPAAAMGAMFTAINAHETAAALVQITGTGASRTFTMRYPGLAMFSPSTAVNLTPANAGTYTRTETHVQTVTTLEDQTIKTDDIAARIETLINALGDGWAATREGSVVKVTNSNGDITNLACSDSRGNTNITAVWNKVDTFDVLPLVCEHGHIITVAGDPVAHEDDYYVKFVATAGSGFGPGHWVESWKPSDTGVQVTRKALDEDTMPHQLVRKEHATNGRYFEYGPVAWSERVVGDETSAPLPSFVSDDPATSLKYIDDIFFWRNRLGFLSGQNVVMSEASVYFNLFRTTARAVLDSDPIDLAIPHTSVVRLKHAVPFDDELYCFSEQAQFKVTSDTILSPARVQSAPVLEYTILPYAKPCLVSRGIFFAHPRGDFSGLQQIVGSPNTNRVDTLDVAAAVPKYVEGATQWIVGSDSESCLLMKADGDPSKLYVYKYHDSGQDRLQSAWHTYSYGDGEVLGAAFVGSTLYALVQRFYGVCLESSTITPGSADTGFSSPVYLDRRVYAGPSTAVPGSYSNPTTTWTLPFTLDPDDAVKVVRADTGALLTTANPTSTTVTATGDYSAVNVYIGVKYTATYEFTHPVLRETSGSGKSPVVGGRLQVLRGRISYADSQYFNVNVAPSLRTALDATFDNSTDDTGVFSFGVDSLASQVTVTVTNDSHRPSNLTNVEWECNYNSHTTRAPS